MVKICPVSDRNINENVSRLNATFTFLSGTLYLFTGSFWFLIILLADFILRLISEGKLSPVIKMSYFISENLNFRRIMINAGPKIFAAQIGLLLSVISLIFWIYGFHPASYSVAGILVFFSFLEFAFGFCIACKIYPFALILNDLRQLK